MNNTYRLRNYLKKFRKESGLTQRELTYLLGQTHDSTVSRYERNDRVPSLRTLMGYEAIFGKTLRELFAGVFEAMAPGVLARARRMSRKLDAIPQTPEIKVKVDFLNDVIASLRRIF